MGTPIGGSALLAVGWFTLITALASTTAVLLSKRRTAG